MKGSGNALLVLFPSSVTSSTLVLQTHYTVVTQLPAAGKATGVRFPVHVNRDLSPATRSTLRRNDYLLGVEGLWHVSDAFVKGPIHFK